MAAEHGICLSTRLILFAPLKNLVLGKGRCRFMVNNWRRIIRGGLAL
jgi:hypothetical protein